MDNNMEIKNTPSVNAPVKKNRRVLKSGSYTVGVSAIVIAIVIAVNLLISVLPASVTELDMTKESLYTIGDTTKEIVGGLEENVNLYYICEEGSEDMQVEKIVNSYAELSDKITVTKVDPAVNPNFVSQYTTEEVTSNSIIVVSDKRTTVAAYEDFVRFNVEGYAEMSYSEYNNYYMQYYYSTGAAPTDSVTQLFYGEQYITSAVSYVVADNIPSLYYTTGHGEVELSETYTGYVTTENYEYKSISLLNTEIPEDAEAILILAPSMDFTEAEVDSLIAYVKAGGDVILISDYQTYSNASRPNLAKLCAEMGMESVDGLVMEGDTNRYFQRQNYVIPQIGATDDTSPASRLATTNMYTLMLGSHAIKSTEAEGITVTNILTTSDQAYLKTVIDENTTYEKQDTDVDGQYVLGAASSFTDGTGGRFVWYSSTSIIDVSMDSVVGRGNSQMFIATLNWMAGKMETISIIGKDISVTPLTMTESTVSAWKTVLCVIVPVAVAVTGLVVWVRRRRR